MGSTASKTSRASSKVSIEADRLKILLKTPRSTQLPPANLSAILSSLPFVSIPGTFNARCLSSHSSFPTAIAPSVAFRAGSLEKLTPEGQDALKRLGIKTIFDLRSLKERSEFPEPEIEGIQVMWMPSTVDNETTVVAQAEKQVKKSDQVFSLITMYMDILRTHAAAYAGVLKHIGTHPGEPFLFHCTAGKDRTGVLAFLLEDLAGSDIESMNVEYALTRVGVEPVKDFLIHKLMGGRDVSIQEVQRIMNSPKMKTYSEIPLDLMARLKKAVGERWEGGVVGYAKIELRLTEEEIQAVKNGLRGETA